MDQPLNRGLALDARREKGRQPADASSGRVPRLHGQAERVYGHRPFSGRGGEIEVQDHKVRLFPAKSGHGGGPIAGRQNAIAGLFQVAARHPDDLWFVIDDENGFHGPKVKKRVTGRLPHYPSPVKQAS